jgi:hypothetical protein
MSEENLKDRSLNDLQQLLAISQRNLATSMLYKHGTALIQQNKEQLARIQKAMADKGAEPVLVKR